MLLGILILFHSSKEINKVVIFLQPKMCWYIEMRKRGDCQHILFGLLPLAWVIEGCCLNMKSVNRFKGKSVAQDRLSWKCPASSQLEKRTLQNPSHSALYTKQKRTCCSSCSHNWMAPSAPEPRQVPCALEHLTLFQDLLAERLLVKKISAEDGQKENQENKGTIIVLVPVSPWLGLLFTWADGLSAHFPECHTPRHSPTVLMTSVLGKMYPGVKQEHGKVTLHPTANMEMQRKSCFSSKCPSCTGMPVRM